MEHREQGTSFLDLVRGQIGVGDAKVHSLFRFLCAKYFDTVSVIADLTELRRSNIAAHCGREVFAALKHCLSEWKRMLSLFLSALSTHCVL